MGVFVLLEKFYYLCGMKSLEKTCELYVSPIKERNIEKFGHVSNQCECCGKIMTDGESKMVHMNTLWLVMENTILTDEDALNHGFESQGYFSIGNSCAKKMKKQFIHN